MNKLYVGLAIVAVALVLYVMVMLLKPSSPDSSLGASDQAAPASAAAAPSASAMPAADPSLGCLSEPGLHLTRGWAEGDDHVWSCPLRSAQEYRGERTIVSGSHSKANGTDGALMIHVANHSPAGMPKWKPTSVIDLTRAGPYRVDPAYGDIYVHVGPVEEQPCVSIVVQNPEAEVVEGYDSSDGSDQANPRFSWLGILIMLAVTGWAISLVDFNAQGYELHALAAFFLSPFYIIAHYAKFLPKRK